MDPNVNLYDELPPFANKANREKQAMIIQKTAELQGLTSDCDEFSDRLKVIQDHLKNVQLEVSTTEGILAAKKKEVESEEHLEQVALRELGKIESDLKKFQDEENDIAAKASQVEAKTFTSQQRIEKFKEEAQINEQELEQWVQAARDKEEDFLVLQRYQKEDESKIRSMLLELEKGTGLVDGKKAELDNEVTTTRALQIELNMTAEQFRKLHEDRSQLLAQWESTLATMQALNEQIETTTDAFELRKEEVARMRSQVQEQKKNLEDALAANVQYERELTIGDHNVSNKHKQHEVAAAELNEFKETLQTQRHKLDKLESDARAYQTEIDDFHDKTAQENAKRLAFLNRLRDTENALGTQKDSTDELNQQTNVMNDFLKQEEQQLKQLEKAIETEKNSIFKLSQEVYTARKEEKNLLAEIQGSQSRAKNLQGKIEEFDHETQKQMELLYNSNFQIQQMARKIARIEGDRTEEEKLELQTQIDHLTKVLNTKLETEKNINQQLHRLELDLRQAGRQKERLEVSADDVSTRLNEINIDQDSLDKSMIRARSQKEQVLVQINMLRLQVEKLTDQVNYKCDELISLENRRQQLQISMQERILEIDSHLQAIRTQLKTEEEARHKANIELQERKKRADTLESKYEVTMGKYKVDGEEVSQTYHVIKFAQEREDITRRGNELDEEVRKAFRELHALERTMAKLNGQNTSFRSKFTAVTEGDSDLERKKTLEEQKSVTQQRLNARKAEARSALEERMSMEQTYQQTQNKIQSLNSEIGDIRPQIDKLGQDNKLLKEKVARATRALTTEKEKARRNAVPPIPLDAPYPSTLLEMDIEVKSTKSIIEQAVADLSTLAEQNTEIEPSLNIGLAQMNLKLKKLGAIQQRMTSNRTPSITTPQNSSRSTSSKGSVRSNTSALSIGSTGSMRSQTSAGSRGSEKTPRRSKIPQLK